MSGLLLNEIFSCQNQTSKIREQVHTAIARFFFSKIDIGHHRTA
jgi:hypothetical protein